MSITYSEDDKRDDLMSRDEGVYTPVYARGRGKKKGVKTWMILAPVSVVTLGGLGVLALTANEQPMGGAESALEPASAPMFEAPLNLAAPVAAEAPAADMLAAETPAAPALAAAPTPTPVERAPVESAPVERAPVQRTQVERAAPVASEPAPAEVVEPMGPRPYQAAPVVTVAPAEPAAPIVVQVPQG